MKSIKRFLGISVTVILVLGTVACDKNVTGVRLDQTSMVLRVDETRRLSANVLPADAADKAVTWSSSNPNVATVVNGLVTAKSEGSAVITVTTKDGNKTATCSVTVNNRIVSYWEMDSVCVDVEFEDWIDSAIKVQILEEINSLIPFQNEIHVVWDFLWTGKVIIYGQANSEEASYSIESDKLTVVTTHTLTGKYSISNNKMDWTIDRSEGLETIGVKKAVLSIVFVEILSIQNLQTITNIK